MSQLHVRRLDSIEQIRGLADSWDGLWWRSAESSSMARAEPVAQWLEHFAPRAALSVLVVEDNQHLAAALPLVGRRLRNMLPVGDLPSNCWASNGHLLLDESDAAPAVELLVGAIDELHWPLLWLEDVPLETPRWQAVVDALHERHLVTEMHPRYRIGQTKIEGDFESYFFRRSRSFRQGIRKKLRRLEHEGPVELKIFSTFSDQEVDVQVHRAFQIESLGWKTAAGGTVLGTPGMLDFFSRQGRVLAGWGDLRIVFLEHRGKRIAFEFGWVSKGVYHCFKIGYDPAYARWSPGQLLRMLLLERLFNQPGHVMVDFQGPLSDAVSSWCTSTYPIGRLVIAPRRLGSRALMAGYRALVPMARRLRKAGGGLDPPAASMSTTSSAAS